MEKSKYNQKKLFLFSFLVSMFFLFVAICNASENPVVINMTASIVKKTAEGSFIGGWDPKKIEVKQGDTVILKIKSLDASHVFSLSGYNITSDEIDPGSPVEVKFVADKVGTFSYSCQMECGPLHKNMVGQFIVDPK